MDFYDRAKIRYTYHSKNHASQHTDEYVFSQLIPYIGNKRKLLPLIVDGLRETGLTGGTAVDIFSGSTVVARMFKQMGFKTLVNDWEPYAEHLGNCFIGLNEEPEFSKLGGADRVLELLNNIEPREDYVTTYLCPSDDNCADPNKERMFFTRENGMIIDAMRCQMQEWHDGGVISDSELSYLVAPLLYAASYASNTSGLFNAYHAGWGGGTGTGLDRIKGRLFLRKPILHNNTHKNAVFRQDAEDFAEGMAVANTLLKRETDVVYLDPPYNQHSYGSNYHVLNTIALWDKPELSKEIMRGNKSAIRKDWQESRRSAYNSSAESKNAYASLLNKIKANFLLVSYSTEGNIPVHELIEESARHGRLSCVMEAYQRYRVSKQRPSARPRTLEFVLVVNRNQAPGGGDEVLDKIIKAEKILNEAAVRS